MISGPLHALTSAKTMFAWNEAADLTFKKFKILFFTASILLTPDPNKPFIVEVDASKYWSRGSSQSALSGGKVHLWAFFSRSLSYAVRNYDVGEQELLAIKMVLKEWRHWLESAKEPFQVWTDHKNPEYLKTAKHINPRQVRWALFFCRFDFVLSYRPSTKNTKPDKPPLFSVQQREAQVPSAHRAAMTCQRIWRKTRRALLKSSAVYVRGANRLRSVQPSYQVGEKVWIFPYEWNPAKCSLVS